MRRSSFNGILRQMEHLRVMSYEAETVREEKRLVREYARLYRTIKPYVEDPSKLENDAQ